MDFSNRSTLHAQLAPLSPYKEHLSQGYPLTNLELLQQHADWCLLCPDPNSSMGPDAFPLQPRDSVLLKTLHADSLQPDLTQ